MVGKQTDSKKRVRNNIAGKENVLVVCLFVCLLACLLVSVGGGRWYLAEQLERWDGK